VWLGVLFVHAFLDASSACGSVHSTGDGGVRALEQGRQ